MNRRITAFLVAPLAVPILLGPYLYSPSSTPSWFVAILVMSLIAAYGGVAILGIPTYLFLRARNWTGFWIAPVAGFVIGGVVWTLFGAFLGAMLGHGLASIVSTLITAGALKDILWPFGPVGAAVGALLWFIARPDRQSS